MPFERLLEDFAEIASDWFWEMDADLRFSYFSSRLAEVAGVEPDREGQAGTRASTENNRRP